MRANKIKNIKKKLRLQNERHKTWSAQKQDLFGSLADYRIISQNVALKAVTRQKMELINLND